MRTGAATRVPGARWILGLGLAVALVAWPALESAGGSPARPPHRPHAETRIRLNQVGYLPEETKVALALTSEDLAGRSFEVVTEPGGTVVLSAAVGSDRGPYGNLSHLYELDFSALKTDGLFRVRSGTAVSPPFSVGEGALGPLVPLSLRFFRAQRCGDKDPEMHGACHMKDGVARGGPLDGSPVDASGGWHDAGDYLKFVLCHGFTLSMILSSYLRHPGVFPDQDGDGTPEVLEETRVGLDWVAKMWDPQGGVLYAQVGDATDHDEWRMPEGDDTSRPRRIAYACPEGKGANLAGAAASCLALGSVVWGESGRPWSDVALSRKWLSAARELYAYAKTRPAVYFRDFYEDADWKDDMALAGAQLYRATGEASYLGDALAFARQAGAAGSLDWASVGALALYELGRLDPSFKGEAAALLGQDLAAYESAAASSPWRTAVAPYFWGCNESMTGAALEALWYEELSGDPAHRAMAQSQRDWLMGANPWGVCWVSGAGTVWPRDPHHQVADLTSQELLGFWDEGPIPEAEFDALGITLREPDEYEAFQTPAAVFHDDVEDYATNEPTLTMNGAGIALLSWYAPSGAGLAVSASASPASGPAPLLVQLEAQAAGGQAPYAFSWTFGDGASGTGAMASHTYAAEGTFTASVTVKDSASATAGASVTVRVTAPVVAPAVGSVRKAGSPFRIIVRGSGFQEGIRVFIGSDTAPWSQVAYKGAMQLVLKGGSALKTEVPKNTPTSLRFLNPDGGETTITWGWP